MKKLLWLLLTACSFAQVIQTFDNVSARSLVVSGNSTLLLGQNQLNLWYLDAVLYVDGVHFTTIQGCLAALGLNGGTCRTPDGYRETFTSQITGLQDPNNLNPAILELGRDNIITANVGGGVCAIPVGNGSAIVGPSGTIGAGTVNQGGSVIQPSATANLSALICNNIPSTGTQEYFALANVFVNDNPSAMISGALVDLQAVFVPSYIRDTIIAPSGHVGLRLRDISGAGFGPFTCDNCWLNGLTTAGSQPLIIQSVASGALMSGINFNGGAIEHAGTGQYEALIDGSAGSANIISGVNFNGTYCENSYSASSCFKVRDAQNVNFNGVNTGASAGTDVINISQSASSRTFGVTVKSLRDSTSGFTNLINDTIHSFTITAPSASGYLPFYSLGSTDITVWPFTIAGEKLRIDSGVTADAGGFKHKRVTGCTTGATAGNTCTTTVTWSTAFADANYTPVCTLLGPSTLGHLAAISTDVIAAASVKVETVTDTNAAIAGTVNCIAVHD